MSKPKTERQQLSKVVDLSISPARVRALFDHGLVNQEKEAKDSIINERIFKIRKEDCPVGKPELPESPGKKASKEDKEAYQVARAEYLAALKEYNEYSSPRYTRLELLHGYCRQLQKLADLLMKNKTASVQREIDNIILGLHDKMSARKDNETDEDYEKRAKKFEAKGYTGLRTKAVDFTNPDSVHAELARVRKANPDLEMFFDKDLVSKERIRFNDQTTVAVAAFMEATVEQLVYHTIDATIRDRKKTMKPDHCVSSGIEDCSLFPLISNLPHYQAIVDRQKRKKRYEASKLDAKARSLRENRRIASTSNKPVKKKFVFEKWSEVEEKAGFAKIVDGKKQDGTPKKIPLWYGIDIEREDEADATEKKAEDGEGGEEARSDENKETNFVSYARKVCKHVLLESRNPYADEIKISGQIAKFFSDLIVDFIKRLVPLAMLHIEDRKTKTIDGEVILMIVKHILLDSYKQKSVKMSLTDDHSELFESVKKKMEACYVHQTGAVPKRAAEKVAAAHSEEPVDDLDEPAEEEEGSDDERVPITVTPKASPAKGKEHTPSKITPGGTPIKSGSARQRVRENGGTN